MSGNIGDLAKAKPIPAADNEEKPKCYICGQNEVDKPYHRCDACKDAGFTKPKDWFNQHLDDIKKSQSDRIK